MRRKVLIVEDEEISRRILKGILEDEYDIAEAADGVEAMKVLEQEKDLLSAVVLDLVMPKMDGFEVMDRMKKNPDLAKIPIMIATITNDREIEGLALESGAIDYCMKPYDARILKSRLWNTIKLREQAACINAEKKDALTGLESRNAFFEHVKELVSKHEPGYYIISSFDIDRFKLINDRYGNAKGDDILRQISRVFQEEFVNVGAVISRIMADNFAILYPRSFSETEALVEIRERISELDGSISPISYSIGRYFIEDVTLDPSVMYDRAVLAKESVKGRYDEHVAVYHESMREHILSEQEIINDMNKALKEQEFEIWFQPQFSHVTGALIGAEALARWRHPKKGLIMPANFIHIFEQNGFIYELDKNIWEQVCRFLRDRKDRNLPVPPISVNVSRYDVFRDDLISVILDLVRKYHISRELLRFEITESAFEKSSERIIQVVNELQQEGFVVAIDDFGSGFSSLNILKDVSADVVKLDIRFLEGNDNLSRGGSIVESIIRMTKWLGMSVIAEGVEDLRQADFLKSVGCFYIQGYLYSKPIPVTEFEAIIEEKGYAERMITLEKVKNYDNFSFWDPSSMDTLIFNSFVGGACIFEYKEGKIEILRVNDEYVRILYGDNRMLSDAINVEWYPYMSSVAQKKTRAAMKKAIASNNEVSDEIELINFGDTGRRINLLCRMRVIARTGNRYLFYCMIDDISGEREAKLKEEQTQILINSILANVGNGITAVSLNGSKVDYLFSNDQFYQMLKYTRQQFQDEVKDIYTIFHEDDRDRVFKTVNQLKPGDKPLVLEYCAICRNKSVIRVRMTIVSVYYEEEGKPIQVSVFEDITDEYMEEEREKDLIENLPCGAGVFEMKEGILRMRYLNRKYWKLVRRSRKDTSFDKAINAIQKEDREYAMNIIQNVQKTGKEQECEIHILNGDGGYSPFLVRVNMMRQTPEVTTFYMTYTSIEEDAIVFRHMVPVALDTMMSSTQDFSFVKDRTYNYVCASHAYAKLIGMEDEKELIGKSDYELFDRATAEKYRNDDAEQVLSGKPRVDYIERLPLKDGKVRFSSMSKYLLKDALGNIIGIYGTGRDITENKEAYQRLMLLTDAIPGGLATYEISKDGIRTLYANEGIYNITGYTPEDYTCENHNPLNMVFEDDKEELDTQLRNLYEKGTPLNCFYRIVRKNGEKNWVNIRATATEREDDKVTVNSVLFDVNDQKLQSDKLTKMEYDNRKRYEQELQLRKGLIQNSVLYYQINLTSGIVEEYDTRYPETLQMQVGVLAGECIRERIKEKVLPEDFERIFGRLCVDGLRKAYSEGERSFSTIYRRKLNDDYYHYVQMNAFIMDKPDNGETIAFLHCTDIDKCRRSHLSIETILDEDIESVIFINIMNGVGSVAHIKDKSNLNNVPDDFEFRIESVKWCQNFVLKEDREEFSRFYSVVNLVHLLEEEKVANLVFQIKEGDEIHRKLTKAYYLDKQKDYIVMTRRDITAMYLEEMRQRNELQDAVNRANKANQAKSEFLSHMSHDLRTPLNAVLAFSGKELLEGADETKLKEYLAKVNASGEYLLGIINDVLDMSRIEQNRIKLNVEPYYSDEFEKTISNVIGELCNSKGVAFVMNVSHSRKRGIIADKIRLNQIFINLLSNSVKFTPKGGRVEFILEEQPYIDGMILLHFVVRDNGIGMSEEFLEHAFESFSQEYRDDVDEKNQGTGLGLSIVKELVSMMSGTIAVESKLNEGTIFTIDIAFKTTDSIRKMPQKLIYQPQFFEGIHILLAEDNDLNAEIATKLLEKYNCIIDRAENGEIACSMFADSTVGYYQIILMDVRMPLMGGIAATQNIRSMDRKDAMTVPVIAMTADAFTEDKKMALDAGMNAHIAKPINPELLYSTCYEFIDKTVS